MTEEEEKRRFDVVFLLQIESAAKDMPLYGRRLFEAPPSQTQGRFLIEHTGLRYDQADIYQKLLQIYALERWTCECTWKASLTHAEATQSEISTRKSLNDLVPNHLHKTIFHLIHHSQFD